MYSSKALEERNNDPLPYWVGTIDPLRSRYAGPPLWRSDHDPRPEFQHGKLEANPILVEFRRNGGKTILWTDLAEMPTVEEMMFARRVLHLRSVVYKS